MQDPTELVDHYLAAFNETDGDARREMLDRLLAEEVTYTDPSVDVRGPEQFDAFIAQTQDAFPGFTFTLAGPVDAHHEQARFQWNAGPEEDPDLFVGFDVIVTDSDRIRSVYGFIDVAPAG